MLTTKWLPRRRDETGAVAILVALCATILFVTAALVVDLGFARDVKAQSQDAADASALAAANVLYPDSSTCQTGESTPPCMTDAVNAAAAYAQQNFDVTAADWPGCTDPGHLYVPPGSTPCISFADDSPPGIKPAQPTTVRVVVPTRNVPTGLGALAGVDGVPVSSMAEASVTMATAGGACGLCVLDSSSVSGNVNIAVKNAGVHLNGTPSFSGNVGLTVTGATFTTENKPSISGNFTSSPTPTTSGHVEDPLASLPLPLDTTALPDYGSPSFSGNDSDKGSKKCELQPGRYGSISISGNRNCVLKPGVYAITGSLSLSGNTNVDASAGVTLYFTCGTSAVTHECGAAYPFVEYGGALSYSGNQTLKIHAPASGASKGLAIVYDRHNGSNLDYSGNQSDELIGTIYAASATMHLSGNTSATDTDTSIVVKGFSLSGNGSINVQYTSANNASATKPEIALSR